MNRELKGEMIKKFGSQFKFAHEIGWHEAIVSRVIRGHQSLDQTEKERWAGKLNADVNTLFPEGK